MLSNCIIIDLAHHFDDEDQILHVQIPAPKHIATVRNRPNRFLHAIKYQTNTKIVSKAGENTYIRIKHPNMQVFVMMRREVQIILFGKNEGKRQLGKPRRIWSDSIEMNLTVDGRAWIRLNLLSWMESRTTDSHLKRIISTKC